MNWLKNDLDPIQEELFFAFGLQSTQFVCNAFNQPAILSRFTILMKFKLIVSVVARIGIPRIVVNFAMLLRLHEIASESTDWR